MKQPKPVTVDFETEAIDDRPAYPPKPVGVSIKWPGQPARYYAWGHPTKNNCSKAQAVKACQAAWKHPDGVLCHHGKFDHDVAETYMGMPPLPWGRTHDTLFLLFLDDPHQPSLELKPNGERLLGLPPEEQDAVADWLEANARKLGWSFKISRSKNSDYYFGKYISLAPGDLVGKYANGDTIRTEKLFNLLWKKIKARGMLESYDRERRLMRVLLKMERRGVPVDVKRLKADVSMYQGWQVTLDAWIHKRIKAPAGANLNSPDQLVQILLNAEKIDPTLALRTPTGKISTSGDSLAGAMTDKLLAAVMQYRSQLKTCVGTFMEPWLVTALRSGGLIYTTWNQTKTPSGDHNVGARTGRLSSTPNFQNMPNEFDPLFFHEEPDPKKARKLPRCPWSDLPPLPLCRSYIVPFKGHVLIDRDYSQQEPRILAHFDGGQLMQKYLDNPWIDFHDYAKAELEIAGLFYDRKPVKNTNLGLIYGMGVGKLALKNDMAVGEARNLKDAVLRLYPGLKEMYRDMKIRAAENRPVRTWGGREYYCEPPRVIPDKGIRQFDYKLVNVLIQGSAADCTKEAIIRYDDALVKSKKDRNWFLLLNAHDELVASVPKADREQGMEVLRLAMEGIEFDVPMLSEGTWSPKSWGDMADYDKKGKYLVKPQRKVA